MEKCIKCGAEAKWKSSVNISPLCNKCAAEEVDKLKIHLRHPEEYSVGDFYSGIPDKLTKEDLCGVFKLSK